MTAQQLSERLLALKESRIKTSPCHHLSASRLGHPCHRYLYLLITRWEEQRPHGAGLQGIFDLGNHLESFVISELRAAGLSVFEPTQRSWKINSPLLTGREDIRIQAEDGQLLPCEIKGLSPFEYDRLTSIEDFHNSKRYYVRGYPAQLQTYMYHFGKEQGFFILLNKLSGQIKAIEMPFDWDYADALLKKAEGIYAAIERVEPPEGTEDASICESCNLAHICTAPHIRTETHIDDGSLEELIVEREALRESAKKYDSLGLQIKELAADHPTILAGEYLVTSSTRERKAYTVEAKQYTACTYKRMVRNT